MERLRETSLYCNDTLNSHFLLPFSEGTEEGFILDVTLPMYVELHWKLVPCDVVSSEGGLIFKLLKVPIPQPK